MYIRSIGIDYLSLFFPLSLDNILWEWVVDACVSLYPWIILTLFRIWLSEVVEEWSSLAGDRETPPFVSSTGGKSSPLEITYPPPRLLASVYTTRLYRFGPPWSLIPYSCVWDLDWELQGFLDSGERSCFPFPRAQAFWESSPFSVGKVLLLYHNGLPHAPNNLT
jgi:hypothetical protein